MNRSDKRVWVVTTSRLTWAAALVLLVASVACKKDVVGAQGEPVREDGASLAVTLVDFKPTRVEIEGERGPLVYRDPVLALRLKFENVGEQAFNYKSTHTLQKASNLEAPLLFGDPGEGGELRNNIAGIYLEEGLMAEQQAKDVNLEAGQSVEDVYLFSLPQGGAQGLIVTIPPAMHGGKGVLKIKFNYQEVEAPAPVVHEVKTPIEVGDVTLVVEGAEVVYLPLKDSNKGEGFSKDPELKVSYTLKNNGKEAIVYEPGHLSTAQDQAATLLEDGGSGRYMRVRFGADREVKGQVGLRATIDAGKTQKDFAVFERPPKTVKSLLFRVPGHLFGQTGLVRVRVPYTFADPAKPKALKAGGQ